jgi:iron-sulfur cluster repair protein YtfE (RIC family)
MERTTMNTPRRTAETALEDAHLGAQDQLDQLRELLHDFEAPNTCTDWGHLGSLAHLKELLVQVIEHLQPST